MTGMVRPITAGRMGNFLFQAASAMAYAWDHGMEFTLPNTTNNALHNPIYLQHLVNPNYNPKLEKVLIDERVFCYHERPWMERWREKNIQLRGWWQTEKYFKHHREKLLLHFGFPWAQIKGFVSVHVRRTDYLRLKNKHPYVGEDWIKTAMKRFDGFRFRFFSDDIPWCKANFGRREDCGFSEGQNEVQDLIDMSSCEHHVCSASTFSWWGAWLNQNPNKRVVLPKQWFMPGHGGLDTKDVVPPEWERI